MELTIFETANELSELLGRPVNAYQAADDPEHQFPAGLTAERAEEIFLRGGVAAREVTIAELQAGAPGPCVVLFRPGERVRFFSWVPEPLVVVKQ